MPTFIGTEEEFNHYLMPRILNWIQSLTKPYKRRLNNVCQHCGKKKELQAAHVHGRERKTIVHEALKTYKEGAVYCVDLDTFKDAILEAHHPIEDNFLFLCQDCHREYDSKSNSAAKSARTPEGESQTEYHASPHYEKHPEEATLHHNDLELDIESMLRSIGKWFFLKHFEIIYTWVGSKDALIATILETPCGKEYSGTNTSITGALRLKDAGAMAEALDIIRCSKNVIRDHPETHEIIESILSRHPELKVQDGTCI